MRDVFNHFVNGSLYPKFFAQLTSQTFLEGLANLAFATGKLPQTGEMLSGGTLRDEELAFVEEQGSGNFEVHAITDGQCSYK